MLQVEVARLHDDNREALSLAWIAGRDGASAVRREAAASASLIGHLNLTHPNSIQVIGAHEAGTLEAVVKARNTAMSAQGTPQQGAAENALTGALRQVFALSEAYPNLKANENFQQLQMELTDLENKIAASRRFFNSAVQEYNTGIQRFPAALFAGALGFGEKQFFDLGADRQTVSEAPQVKF